MVVAGLACLLGHQLVVFALFAKQFAVAEGLHPETALSRLSRDPKLEIGILAGLLLGLAGLAILSTAFLRWHAVEFGDLDARAIRRLVIPAVLVSVLGVQTIFASFFLSILTLRKRRD
jgi:hypothetical protein